MPHRVQPLPARRHSPQNGYLVPQHVDVRLPLLWDRLDCYLGPVSEPLSETDNSKVTYTELCGGRYVVILCQFTFSEGGVICDPKGASFGGRGGRGSIRRSARGPSRRRCRVWKAHRR